MFSSTETSNFEQCKRCVLRNWKRRGVLFAFSWNSFPNISVSHCLLEDFRSYAKVELSLLSNLILPPRSFSISSPCLISSWCLILFTLPYLFPCLYYISIQSDWTVSPLKEGDFSCLSFCILGLEHCLIHSRCSLNICWLTYVLYIMFHV